MLQNPTFDFTDFRCIVTGSTRGIGRAIADELARNGAYVGITGRDSLALAEIQKEYQRKGWRHATFACDLSDSAQRQAMVDFFLKTFGGRIDGLVNNAGINILETVGELQEESVGAVFDVNLLAPILLTNAVVPHMKAQKFGRIVNISSLSAVTAFHAHAAYCASKEGLSGFMKVAAMELGPSNITINGVGPTVVLTELGKEAWNSDQEKRRRMEGMIPLGRFLEPQDVVPTVLFLLSEGASMISGQLLLVDGGYMAGKGI